MAIRDDYMKIKRGNMVKIKYKGKLKNEIESASFKGYEGTLEFKIGTGRVLKSFEHELIGMEHEEEKEFTLTLPERNPDLITQVQKEGLSIEKDLQRGMKLIMSLKTGEQTLGTILEVTNDIIIIDFNHPFAGKKLNYKVRVLSIIP